MSAQSGSRVFRSLIFIVAIGDMEAIGAFSSATSTPRLSQLSGPGIPRRRVMAGSGGNTPWG